MNPSSVTSYRRTPLLGAGAPLYLDFWRLRFHVPMIGSLPGEGFCARSTTEHRLNDTTDTPKRRSARFMVNLRGLMLYPAAGAALSTQRQLGGKFRATSTSTRRLGSRGPTRSAHSAICVRPRSRVHPAR